MPNVRIPKGSVEALYVPVVDRAGVIDDLGDATSLAFQVWDNFDDVDEGTPIASGACTFSGMTAITAPIDTSNMEEGIYRLFVTVGLPSESVKLGPFDFVVG